LRTSTKRLALNQDESSESKQFFRGVDFEVPIKTSDSNRNLIQSTDAWNLKDSRHL